MIKSLFAKLFVWCMIPILRWLYDGGFGKPMEREEMKEVLDEYERRKARAS